MATEQSLNTFNAGENILKTIYVKRNDMRAIAILPFIYFLTEMFKSLTISNV